MTERERFLKTMRYEAVDRPPYYLDGPWDDTFERWFKEGYPKGDSLEKFLDVPAFHYHGTSIDTFLIPVIEPCIIEEHKDYIIRRDCFGATIKDFKEQTTMPMWLDYHVKTPEDLDALLERMQWDKGAGRIPPDWKQQVSQFKNDKLGVVASGGSYYGNLRNLMGVETLSMMMFDAPEAIKRYNDAYHEIIMRTLEIVFADLKGEILYVSMGEDLAYKTAPLLSPAMYREFVMPYQKNVIDFAKGKGIDLFWFDSDGNLDVLFPDMLEAGINIFYPVECAAGMDPVRLRKQYGRDLRMIGGIDKRNIAKGKKAIDEELKKVPALIADGGFIPRIDHSVASDTSLADFLYYFRSLQTIYAEHARKMGF